MDMENKLKGLDHNNMNYMKQFNQTVKESAKKIQERKDGIQVQQDKEMVKAEK